MKSNDTQESWPPLWSIGIAAAIMLIVPFILYAIAPEGPIREGDTVFGNGRHRVALVEPTRYQAAGYDGTCVVEFHDPLVVIKRPLDQPDVTLVVQVQGKTSLQFPFCPPQAEVLVKPHQVFQKPDLLSDLRDSLKELLGR